MKRWLFLIGCLACAHSEPAQAVPSRPAPVAVVELFTSEGCSSCPPADENLAALTAEAERSHERVFTLERHVDYWDDLGWKDPFSLPEHGAGQQKYAERFGNSSIYTPQMVVNGREQFVGSERATARQAIRRGLSEDSAVAVAVVARASPSEPGSIRVEYRIDGRGAFNVEVALLEDTAETQVTRGENAHRRLQHRHVARAFTTVALTAPGNGSWTAPWPAEASTAGCTALVYVSDRKSLAVLGAGSAKIE